MPIATAHQAPAWPIDGSMLPPYLRMARSAGTASILTASSSLVKQPLNQYASHPLGRTVSSSMTIGGWPLDGNYRFGGKLDDVRIYNRALSDAEVLLLSQ